MSRRIRVGVLFGGVSVEHEVSLQSARNVIEAMDKDKYDPVLIGIDKKGQWLLLNSANFLLNPTDPRLIALNESSEQIALVPDESSYRLMRTDASQSVPQVDVFFPILHGTFGEDGSVQGLLKLAGVPFVGCGVLASAAGMDKDVAKRLWRDAGLPVAKSITLRKKSVERINVEAIISQLQLPLFIKPANLGSSVGVSKVKSVEEFVLALRDAFQYDTKVIVEEFIEGREIECSVLGNDAPIASVPGEVLPKHEFYSYEAKYIDENGAALEIPAKLPESISQTFREMAVKAFQAIGGEGMARVDFFLKQGGQVIINEINTIPGFTRISMYPKLWEATGISYPELIDRLITLAMDRFDEERELKRSM